MTQTATTNDISSLVAHVNATLEANEPADISVDSYSGYVGYKPQYIIDAMNETFGFGQWGFEELSNEIVPTKDGGGLAIAQVKVWLKDVDFQPTGWGQARVTKGDLGDARKGAQTDGIKKALSYFSIGNKAYQGLLKEEQAQASNSNKAGQSAQKKQPAQQNGKATNGQAAQQSQPINAPLPSELRAQAKELGKNFDSVVKFLFKRAIPDDELTPDDCKFIHATFEKSAAIRKQAATNGK